VNFILHNLMLKLGKDYTSYIVLTTLGYMLFFGIAFNIFVLDKLEMKPIVYTTLLFFVWIVFTLVITKGLLPKIAYKNNVSIEDIPKCKSKK